MPSTIKPPTHEQDVLCLIMLAAERLTGMSRDSVLDIARALSMFAAEFDENAEEGHFIKCVSSAILLSYEGQQ